MQHVVAPPGFADFGDLTWNAELPFLCPNNPIARLDLYLAAHHGSSITPKAEWAMAPRVVVVSNGPRKGGEVAHLETLRNSPGLEDLWQQHYSVPGPKEFGYNVANEFIANITEACSGDYFKASAVEDGSFTIFNSRTKATKAYPVRK